MELGLQNAGFHAQFLCEIDPNAKRILNTKFPGVPVAPDIRKLTKLPVVDVLTAGFPCQDLSQAGAKRGIAGAHSGLVKHLLRLLQNSKRRPGWLVVENVSYMLRLDRGHAMRFLTRALDELGYRWAYRVVDARSFGVPQRRLRVVLLASRVGDPCDVLFADNVSDTTLISHRLQAPLVVDMRGPDTIELTSTKSYGFYWTEGRIGIGWTTDAVPPIKGGSGLAIASPPAVWMPTANHLGVPSISDGERLQGFPAGWTEAAASAGRSEAIRWKLLGNAVCARVSEWVGKRLVSPGKYRPDRERDFEHGTWPLAAYGHKGGVRAVELSVWPKKGRGPVLARFLKDPLKPLSARAAAGFLDRARRTEKIRYAPEFLSAVEAHVAAAVDRELAYE